MNRITGIDTLRFICAFVVILGHYGFPEITGVPAAAYINGILNNLFPGIAAVMIFFIISGFCIHYPYSQNKSLEIGTFYIQRLLRIGLPALVMFTLYDVFFNKGLGVLWSLICEVIFYFLYPIILKLKKKYSLNIMIIVGFFFSILLCLYTDIYSKVYNGDFHRNGYMFTWIVGLPIWLLGVKLADQYSKIKDQIPVSFLQLNVLRLSVWVFAIVSSMLRFHMQIPYVYTLSVFSLLAYYLLYHELVYFVNKKDNKLLETGGQISYSIYLVHMTIPFVLKTYFIDLSVKTNIIMWIFSIVISLLLAWIFYQLVERPSHRIAKKVKLPSQSLITQ